MNENQIIAKLSNFPKRRVEFDFLRIKNQVLDRISIPQEELAVQGWLASLPRMLKFSVGALGSILIVASLTLGVAVAALESVPGQPAYPLKKIVENIQLRLASEDEKTNLQIKFADKRLQELEKVLEQNKQGKLSEAEAQIIVSTSVKRLQTSTTAAVKAAKTSKSVQSKVSVLTKLVEQSAVLQSAAIETEGEVKLELEKALEETRISQEEAIENIERAGLKVEATPIEIKIEQIEQIEDGANGETIVDPSETQEAQ